MDSNKLKIGLKVSLKEEVWRRIGFHSAPQFWIRTWFHNPMLGWKVTDVGLAICDECLGEMKYPIEDIEIWEEKQRPRD